MIKLIIDTTGGDNSPLANIEGSVSALNAHPDLYVIFSGDEEAIRSALAEVARKPGSALWELRSA